MRIPKRERINKWVQEKVKMLKETNASEYHFYAFELAHSLGYETSEVVPYLKWHAFVKKVSDSYRKANWAVYIPSKNNSANSI